MRRRCVSITVIAAAFLGVWHAWAQPAEFVAGLKFASDRQHEQALGALKETIRSNPAFDRAYVRLATIAKEAGQLEAVRAYFEALAFDNPYAHYGAALASRQASDAEAAEKH